MQDPDSAPSDLNHDLDLIRLWTHKWRISFNQDPMKQAVESNFSKENAKAASLQSCLMMHNAPVMKVDQRKHLGVITDSLLSFSAGIQRFLSKYLSRNA